MEATTTAGNEASKVEGAVRGDGTEGEQPPDGATDPDPLRPAYRENILQMYVMGDIQVLNDWFEDKPVTLQLPNWMLRAVGAPIFLNNPISGLLILVAMFYHSPWMAVNALLGLITAITTALAVNVNRGSISNGGATFHGMLVGIVLSVSIDRPDWHPWVIFPVIIMAALSVFLASGLDSLFGRANLPAFNLPFVLAAFVFIATMEYSPDHAHFPIKKPQNTNREDLDWRKVWPPLLLAGAQIYGSDDLVVGALVLVAQFIASPIIAIHALLSAIVSVLTAVGLGAPPEEIYNGTWSYNAMLTCTALAGFFYVLTIKSHVLALFSAMFATVMFGAVGSLLKPAGLPVIAFPFVITAAIFLSVVSESQGLKRVPLDSISYPEKHRRLYKWNLVAARDNIP